MNNLSFNLSREINERVASDIKFSKFVLHSLRRHFIGDWGDCCEEDIKANNLAIENGNRLFSVYKYDENEIIWTITEAEPCRYITTVLFPDEY